MRVDVSMTFMPNVTRYRTIPMLPKNSSRYNVVHMSVGRIFDKHLMIALIPQMLDMHKAQIRLQCSLHKFITHTHTLRQQHISTDQSCFSTPSCYRLSKHTSMIGIFCFIHLIRSNVRLSTAACSLFMEDYSTTKCARNEI